MICATCLVALGLVSSGCSQKSSQEILEAYVKKAARAAEDRDTGEVLEHVAENFCAVLSSKTPRPKGDRCLGLDRAGVRRMLIAKLLPKGAIKVWLAGLKTQVMEEDDRATLSFIAVLARYPESARSPSGVPLAADAMKFTLTAERREGQWTFTDVEGEPVDTQNALPPPPTASE